MSIKITPHCMDRFRRLFPKETDLMSDLEMLVYMRKLIDDMLVDKPNNIGATFILEMGIFKNVVITCFREEPETKALT